MKIKINKSDGHVFLNDKYLARENDNLIQMLDFEFADENLIGQGQLDFTLPSGKTGYIDLTYNNGIYSTAIYNSICKEGELELQFLVFLSARFIKTVDTEIKEEHTYYIKNDNNYEIVQNPNIEEIGNYYVQSVPLYHSKKFNLTVDPSINAVLEENEEYPTKIALINSKLIEIDNNLEKMSTTIEDSEAATKRANIISETLETKLEEGELNGATFTPNVSTDGDISWTNDKGLVNPQTKNIKGPQGPQGSQGIPGPKGDPGDKPTKGVDYFTEQDKAEIVSEVTKDATSEFNTNVEEKLQEYNENAEEKVSEFNANVDNIEKQVTQANSVYNALPKITGSGTDITLEDTAETPLKLTLKENTYQETTTGEQLVNLNNSPVNPALNLSYTYIDDILTLTSTGGQFQAYWFLVGDLDDYAGQTITLSVESKSTSQGLTRMAIGKCNNEYGNRTNIVQNDNNSLSATIPSSDNTFKKLIVGFWVSLAETVPSGATSTYVKPLVNIGNSRGDYEPYTNGASPNPDYPQDIQVVSGDNTIKIQNKNLINPNKFIHGVYNGSVGSSGTITPYSNSFTTWVEILAGETYVFSGNLSQVNSNVIRAFVTNDEVAIGTRVTRISNISANGTYTNSNNYKYLVLEFLDVSTYNNTWQLEKGSTATDCVEHKEQVFPINLPVKNLFDAEYYNDRSKYINAYQGYFYAVELGDEFKRQITASISLKGTAQTGIVVAITNSYGSSPGGNSRILTADGNIINRTFDFTNAEHVYLQIGSSIQMAALGRLNDIFSNYNIQIEEGDKANSYWAYGTTPIEYCGIGNYEDEFFKNVVGSKYYDSTLELNKWYLKKRTADVVLDGSETVQYIAVTQGSLFRMSLVKSVANIPLYSNYYRGVSRGTDRTNNTFYYNPSASADLNKFDFIDNRFDNADDFKAWLQEKYSIGNPVKIKYIADEPQDILLNDTLQEQLDNIYYYAYSYQGQTNISQENNDLPFIIDASAIYDLNNLLTRVATLETEV